MKEREKELKATLAIKEKELQEKCTKIAIQLVSVAGEVDTSSLSKAMSQIGLKYIELTKLKQ